MRHLPLQFQRHCQYIRPNNNDSETKEAIASVRMLCNVFLCNEKNCELNEAEMSLTYFVW